MIRVDWKGKMEFEATPPTGNRWTMDANPEVGDRTWAPHHWRPSWEERPPVRPWT
jgi:hypothetical protein